MKKITLLTLSVMFTLSIFAKKVEVADAKIVAQNFYSLQFEQIKGSIPDNLIVSESFILTGEKGETLLYVFNFENGFVLVSADDAITPILGFSLKNKYHENNQPDAVIDLLEHYKNQIINAIKNKLESTTETSSQWSTFLNQEDTRAVADCRIWPKFFVVNPLLTTTWAQSLAYNNKCPEDDRVEPAYGHHVPAGCQALAMAQVMKYWNYPTNGNGIYSYNDPMTFPDAYGIQSANFGNTTYNWSEMPNSLYDNSLQTKYSLSYNSVEAVSTLIYHCGVANTTDYGYNASGATSNAMTGALVNYFNYSSSANLKYKSNYSADAWESILCSNLSSHKPVLYRGQGNGSGHVFVLDGYTKMQTECCTYYALFHINWGWNGDLDGYYYLTDLTPGVFNYNDIQAVVTSITPPNVTYSPPPQPSYISEPACSPHCNDAEVDYFVPLMSQATGYEWDITGLVSAGVTGIGRYASVFSHHYGTATLWCRGLNNGVPGPWKTKTIYIEDCGKTSDPLVDVDGIIQLPEFQFTNLEPLSDSEIEVYPNPAKSDIHINLPDSLVHFSFLEFLNMQAEVVYKTEINHCNIVINTQGIQSGVYILRVVSTNSIVVKKVIISK